MDIKKLTKLLSKFNTVNFEQTLKEELFRHIIKYLELNEKINLKLHYEQKIQLYQDLKYLKLKINLKLKILEENYGFKFTK